MSNRRNEIKIRPIPSNFEGRGEVKGYSFALLGMTDKAFLYEVSNSNGKHYEVFFKRINSRFACVSYPTAKSFGILAWTMQDLKSAIKKFNSISFFRYHEKSEVF